MDYQPGKFECCRLSLASFIANSEKRNDDVIMTSFHTFGIWKSQFCRTEYRLSSK